MKSPILSHAEPRPYFNIAGSVCLRFESNSFGFLWVPLGSSGFLWVSLGFSGFLWVPLDLLNGFKSVFLLSFLRVLGGLYGMPTLWGSLGSIAFGGHMGLYVSVLLF